MPNDAIATAKMLAVAIILIFWLPEIGLLYDSHSNHCANEAAQRQPNPLSASKFGDGSYGKVDCSHKDKSTSNTYSQNTIVSGLRLIVRFFVHHDRFSLSFGTLAIASLTGWLAVATLLLVMDSREASRRELRAYVGYSGCRWISHFDPVVGRLFWRIRPIWANTGKTPTKKLVIYVNYAIVADPPTSLPPPEDFRPLRTAIPPNGSIEGAFRNVLADELDQIKHGTLTLHMWGVAKYHDVFPGTPEHVTKFYMRSGVVSGDPLMPWDANTNPLEIMFAIEARHNCSDDECLQEHYSG